MLLEYTDNANGKQIEVQTHEEFIITLPETRTAGYRWTLTGKAEPQCALVEDSAQPAAGVGGSGTHRWRFRAVSPGTGEITAAYARSWQAGSEPAKTFTLKVQVRH
jgi:predicted secreted protein